MLRMRFCAFAPPLGRGQRETAIWLQQAAAGWLRIAAHHFSNRTHTPTRVKAVKPVGVVCPYSGLVMDRKPSPMHEPAKEQPFWLPKQNRYCCLKSNNLKYRRCFAFQAKYPFILLKNDCFKNGGLS